jgi:hypothetical protein
MKWLWVALLSTTAVAQNFSIIGYIRNQAGGEITLSTESLSCKEGERAAFIRSQGGKVSLFGCWRLIQDQIWIRWSDGDVYAYDLGNLITTPEFDRYISQ